MFLKEEWCNEKNIGWGLISPKKIEAPSCGSCSPRDTVEQAKKGRPIYFTSLTLQTVIRLLTICKNIDICVVHDHVSQALFLSDYFLIISSVQGKNMICALKRLTLLYSSQHRIDCGTWQTQCSDFIIPSVLTRRKPMSPFSEFEWQPWYGLSYVLVQKKERLERARIEERSEYLEVIYSSVGKKLWGFGVLNPVVGARMERIHEYRRSQGYGTFGTDGMWRREEKPNLGWAQGFQLRQPGDCSCLL